ncbi:hypothetical protein D3C78_1743940 [compost metagenome]
MCGWKVINQGATLIQYVPASRPDYADARWSAKYVVCRWPSGHPKTAPYLHAKLRAALERWSWHKYPAQGGRSSNPGSTSLAYVALRDTAGECNPALLTE